MTVLERFTAKFTKSDDFDCWVWKGAHDRYGYGRFKLDGKSQKVHRVSYALFVGELDPLMDVDHTCCKGDRASREAHRRCGNPAHLEQVTHVENMHRIA